MVYQLNKILTSILSPNEKAWLRFGNSATLILFIYCDICRHGFHCLNHRQHRKRVGKSTRAKRRFIIGTLKERERERELWQSPRTMVDTTFVFTSRHPFPVLILRYTCNLPRSVDPLLATCVSSREVCLYWPI